MSSNWADRIKKMEINPPEKAWDKINASLDESLAGSTFPAKLYNLEVNPPPAAWSNIDEALHEEPVPVIPIKKRLVISILPRLVIAACLLGLIVFGAIKFFRPDNSSNRNGVAIKKGEQAPADSQSTSPRQDPEAPTDRPSTQDDDALERSKQTYARLDAGERRTPNKSSGRLYHSPALLASSFSTKGLLEKAPQIQYSHRAAVNDLPDNAQPGRYLMYKDADGRFIRISKKLTNLFCCVSGEEQDDNCTDQLKKWQERIASSSFVPSPDNFMDILDLVNSLQN